MSRFVPLLSQSLAQPRSPAATDIVDSLLDAYLRSYSDDSDNSLDDDVHPFQLTAAASDETYIHPVRSVRSSARLPQTRNSLITSTITAVPAYTPDKIEIDEDNALMSSFPLSPLAAWQNSPLLMQTKRLQKNASIDQAMKLPTLTVSSSLNQKSTLLSVDLDVQSYFSSTIISDTNTCPSTTPSDLHISSLLTHIPAVSVCSVEPHSASSSEELNNTYHRESIPKYSHYSYQQHYDLLAENSYLSPTAPMSIAPRHSPQESTKMLSTTPISTSASSLSISSPLLSPRMTQEQLGMRHTIPHALTEISLLSSARALFRSERLPCAVCSKGIKLHGVYCKHCGIVLHRECSAKIQKTDELFRCGLPREYHKILNEHSHDTHLDSMTTIALPIPSESSNIVQNRYQLKTKFEDPNGFHSLLDNMLLEVSPDSNATDATPSPSPLPFPTLYTTATPSYTYNHDTYVSVLAQSHQNLPSTVYNTQPTQYSTIINHSNNNSKETLDNPLSLDTDTTQILYDAASRTRTSRHLSRTSWPLYSSSKTLDDVTANDELNASQLAYPTDKHLSHEDLHESNNLSNKNDSVNLILPTSDISTNSFDNTTNLTVENNNNNNNQIPSTFQLFDNNHTTTIPPNTSTVQSHLKWTTDDYIVVPLSEVVLGRQVGSGSFGTVYKGVWLGIDVAVKKLKHNVPTTTMVKTLMRQCSLRLRASGSITGERVGGYDVDKEGRVGGKLAIPHMVFEELKILRRLRHPHIVLFMAFAIDADPLILDTDNNGDGLGIITQFCDNGSLYEHIHDTRNISEYSLMRMQEWSLQIALGLEYLHARGVVHCDLKSPNVLLDKEYNVKLADFGLSKVVDRDGLAERESLVGSVYWLAPELARGRQDLCSPSIDIWALGMILYELATRKLPYYPLDRPEALLYRIGSGQLPDMQYIRQSIDSEYVDVLRLCLRREAADRISAKTVSERLQQQVMKTKRRLKKTRSFDPRVLPSHTRLEYTEE